MDKSNLSLFFLSLTTNFCCDRKIVSFNKIITIGGTTITEPTRFYLDKGNLGLSKLCWFHEYKEYEMMFGFCGLASKEAYFASQYEDRYMSKKEMLNLRINYADVGSRQKQLATHFTMHKSGKFHLGLKGGDKIYVDEVQLTTPLSDNIEEFLDFFIVCDLASKYEKTIEKPKIPFIRIPVNPDNFVCLRGRFSGVNFDLKTTVMEEEKLRMKKDNFAFPVLCLDGKIFKGIFTYDIYESKGIDFSKRPDGTYVLMAFPTEKDEFLIKTFVFN